MGSSLLTAELRDPLLGWLENRGTVSKPEAGLEHHLGMTHTVLSNLTVLREGIPSSHHLARDSGLGTQPGRRGPPLFGFWRPEAQRGRPSSVAPLGGRGPPQRAYTPFRGSRGLRVTCEPTTTSVVSGQCCILTHSALGGSELCGYTRVPKGAKGAFSTFCFCLYELLLIYFLCSFMLLLFFLTQGMYDISSLSHFL